MMFLAKYYRMLSVEPERYLDEGSKTCFSIFLAFLFALLGADDALSICTMFDPVAGT